VKSDTKKHYRAILQSRLQALHTESQTNAESRNPVTLDQQSVGRLSRMDALQQQAMAKATQARREVEIRQINAAIQRIEEDEFGYCDICGEPIPEPRLSLSPTATNCVSCAGHRP